MSLPESGFLLFVCLIAVSSLCVQQGCFLCTGLGSGLYKEEDRAYYDLKVSP